MILPSSKKVIRAQNIIAKNQGYLNWKDMINSLHNRQIDIDDFLILLMAKLIESKN